MRGISQVTYTVARRTGTRTCSILFVAEYVTCEAPRVPCRPPARGDTRLSQRHWGMMPALRWRYLDRTALRRGWGKWIKVASSN